MIVTAHQPNYLPGLNVIEKVELADAVIWLDDVQYERGGWTNRNRMPDGSWLTIPLDHATLGGPIREVRISDHDPGWGERHVRTIRQHYGHAPLVDAACQLIGHDRPGGKFTTLTFALLALLVKSRPSGEYIQSLLGDRRAQDSASERLAGMVDLVGGTVYLSGPSGRRYLDEKPFKARGIKVKYYEPRDDRSCVLSRCSAVPA